MTKLLSTECSDVRADPTNPLEYKSFKKHDELGSCYQYRLFATAALCLNGQDFHLKSCRPLVPSGRGIALAALQSGCVTVETDNETLTLKPADIAILSLDEATKLISQKAIIDCLIIDEKLNSFLPTSTDESGAIVLSALQPANSLLFQQFICFRAYSALMVGDDVEDLLSPLLMMLNTILKRYANRKESTANSQKEKVCAFIKKHLLDPTLSPDMIANRLGLSRARLYRLAEALGGIQKYVRTERLKLAREKLQQGGEDAQSITNLAFDLGFSTENAFRRAFKGAFGVTPSQLRQR